MNKYLSVIVPVYNVENSLAKCIDSIKNQTFTDLEIILINDGSTDNSGKTCDDYAKNDSRIKVIHQKNSGVSAARNTGIKISTGDYLTFVDSDDWLEMDMYEEMCKIVQKESDIDIIMCDFKNIKNNSVVQISADIRKGFYSKQEIIAELYPTLLVTENFGRIPIVSVWSCLFKSILLKNKNINFNEKLLYSEDYLFMAEVMVNAKSFYYLKGNYFYNYLQYEDSRSKKFQPIWWENLLYLNLQLEKLLQNCNDYNFTRQLNLQLLHSALFVLNSIYKNDLMTFQQKLTAIKLILNTPELQNTFSNLTFKKQLITHRFILFFIKQKMAFNYFAFLHFISIIKMRKNFKY